MLVFFEISFFCMFHKIKNEKTMMMMMMMKNIAKTEKFNFLSRNKKTKCLYFSKFCVFWVFHKNPTEKIK